MIEGKIDAAFAPVRRELERSFAERGEVGAAVAVFVDGKLVVDAWGGLANRRDGVPWSRDTAALVFSSTKAATSLAAHVLAARGRLDLDAPIARVWPELGAAGKEAITLRQALAHRAGLPAIDEALPIEAAYDWERMTAAIARQVPHWEPGTAHGYHPFTFGWIVGEVVRRVAGRSLGAFVREEIAGPPGLELWIGLPEEHEPRVARLLPPPPPARMTAFLGALLTPDTLTARSFLNPMTFFAPGEANSRAMRAAEIPAANGVATARALAALYAAIVEGGRHGRPEVVPREVALEMGEVVSEGDDLVLLQPTRFSAGFMKTMERAEGAAWFGPSASALGHSGAGGSFGMADPDARVAIGYVMNQMGSGALLNERGQAIVEAVFESLGSPRKLS
jgi:CubicO group peptidase (beta-lactamase class C family)